jgi:hypothetical protein
MFESFKAKKALRVASPLMTCTSSSIVLSFLEKERAKAKAREGAMARDAAAKAVVLKAKADKMPRSETASHAQADHRAKVVLALIP